MKHALALLLQEQRELLWEVFKLRDLLQRALAGLPPLGGSPEMVGRPEPALRAAADGCRKLGERMETLYERMLMQVQSDLVESLSKPRSPMPFEPSARTPVEAARDAREHVATRLARLEDDVRELRRFQEEIDRLIAGAPPQKPQAPDPPGA